MKTGGGGSDENILLVCQQCHDPFCIEVCVMGAISWNEQIGALVINENLCMGCKTCLIACPFGGTLYHPKKEFAVKCDLCGGNPACVEVCLYGALEFLSPEEEGIKKQQRLAERFAKITVR
jgi:Fe-S-cluster-containing hydrogenase component 2